MFARHTPSHDTMASAMAAPQAALSSRVAVRGSRVGESECPEARDATRERGVSAAPAAARTLTEMRCSESGVDRITLADYRTW